MSKHTPEPWDCRRCADDGLWDVHSEAGGGSEPLVVSVRSLPSDAERIVACVNGCAGIEDPEKAVPEMLEALQRLLRASLSADEARLLMVGTNAPAMARDSEPGQSLHARCDAIREAAEQARAVIAKATGEGGAS